MSPVRCSDLLCGAFTTGDSGSQFRALASCPLLSGAGGLPSNGDGSLAIRAITCNGTHKTSRPMLGSRTNGSQAQRQLPGQGQTRTAIAPTMPHRKGGQKEKLLLLPCRIVSIPAPIAMSQLPKISRAHGTPRIKQTAHSKKSATTCPQPAMRLRNIRQSVVKPHNDPAQQQPHADQSAEARRNVLRVGCLL